MKHINLFENFEFGSDSNQTGRKTGIFKALVVSDRLGDATFNGQLPVNSRLQDKLGDEALTMWSNYCNDPKNHCDMQARAEFFVIVTIKVNSPTDAEVVDIEVPDLMHYITKNLPNFDAVKKFFGVDSITLNGLYGARGADNYYNDPDNSNEVY